VVRSLLHTSLPLLAATNVLDMPAYQQRALENPAPLTWNNWSRQTGKSFTFSLRRLVRGMLRRRTQVFLSASQRQSRELMDKLRRHCAHMQIQFELRESDCFGASAVRKLEARLPGGVRIVALPANPMTARGYSGDLLLDEFAMHRDVIPLARIKTVEEKRLGG
jgi:phage FluMu gp28-like protein